MLEANAALAAVASSSVSDKRRADTAAKSPAAQLDASASSRNAYSGPASEPGACRAAPPASRTAPLPARHAAALASLAVLPRPSLLSGWPDAVSQMEVTRAVRTSARLCSAWICPPGNGSCASAGKSAAWSADAPARERSSIAEASLRGRAAKPSASDAASSSSTAASASCGPSRLPPAPCCSKCGRLLKPSPSP